MSRVLQQQRTDNLLLFLPDSDSVLNFRGTKVPRVCIYMATE